MNGLLGFGTEYVDGSFDSAPLNAMLADPPEVVWDDDVAEAGADDEPDDFDFELEPQAASKRQTAAIGAAKKTRFRVVRITPPVTVVESGLLFPPRLAERHRL